jgi:hypothetical protein
VEGGRQKDLQGILTLRQVFEDTGGFSFRGSIGNAEDFHAASEIAGKCEAYSIDEDDEDYCEGARTCFNCRYRRWLADGFQCTRDLLGP